MTARWPARRLPQVGAPERLCRFVASEWAASDPLAEWGEACRAWLAVDSSRRLPFGAHGDLVDVLRESVRVKLAGGSP